MDYTCTKARSELLYDVLDKDLREAWCLFPGLTLTARNLLDRLSLATICRGHLWAEWPSRKAVAAWLASNREETNHAIALLKKAKLLHVEESGESHKVRLRLETEVPLLAGSLKLNAEEIALTRRSYREPKDPTALEMEAIVGPDLNEPFLDAKLESILQRIEQREVSAVPTPEAASVTQEVSAVPTPRHRGIADAKAKAMEEFAAIRAGTWRESSPPKGPEKPVSVVPTVSRVAAAAVLPVPEDPKAAAAATLEGFRKIAHPWQWKKFGRDWEEFVSQDPEYATALLKRIRKRINSKPPPHSPLSIACDDARLDGRWIGGENVGQPI